MGMGSGATKVRIRPPTATFEVMALVMRCSRSNYTNPQLHVNYVETKVGQYVRNTE